MQLLLVEDHLDLAASLDEGLTAEGYDVAVAHDGQAALTHLARHEVDVMILDRDLPVLGGDTVCRLLRAERHPVLILMLTAAASLDDRVTGLDLGADDYLAKPFAYAELLARLRALGRRIAGDDAGLDAGAIETGRIRVDPARRVVECDGSPVRLAPKEYALLETLCLARGTVVGTEELLDEVWGGEASRSVVKLTVHTLRKKLGAPELVVSVAGGYRIEAA